MENSEEQKKSILSYFESDEWKKVQQEIREAEEIYKNECEQFWESLDYEHKLKVFYAVVSRIVKAELEDRGSYRWALYDVFGFDYDSYAIGMECGYFNLHNSIHSRDELKEIFFKIAQKSQLDTSSIDWDSHYF